MYVCRYVACMMHAAENVCMWNASSGEVCILHELAISNVCMYVCMWWVDVSLLVHTVIFHDGVKAFEQRRRRR